MTTEPQIFSAADLFSDNEVYKLAWRRDVPDSMLPLAGASWILAHPSPPVAHLIALQRATDRALSRLHGYALFLLAGNKVYRPDSAVTRYRNLKLWGVLKSGGQSLPDGDELGEHPVTIKGEPHYFGALLLKPGPLEAALRILEKNSLSALVALPPQQRAVISDLIQSGWQLPRDGHCPSWDVLRAVCGADGVVFWTVGAFDDTESGVLAFAKPAVIEHILDGPMDSH